MLVVAVSLGSAATLPLSALLPGNKVAEKAVMVKVELPAVEIAPVELFMDMLLMDTVGVTTSKTFATLRSGTLKVALLIVVVPAVMVIFRLPLAVNNVLLPVPKVNTKSLAPVYAPLPRTMFVTVPEVCV